MKLFILLFFFHNFITSSPIIKNTNFPSCKNCIYYKPSIHSNEFTSSLSKCEKFGSKDIVTGEITYDYANSCRNDELLCGKKGNYFEIEKNIEMKMLKYFILGNIPNIIIIMYFLSVYIFYIYSLTK
jgi:Pyruvate/2-oxoacid:ferredoxin oxidoreductase delta subunit